MRPVTLGVLAHVDAGKTTFCEQLLYHAGALRTPGRVDHRSALLDADPIERERGITIFSDQTSFSHAGRDWYLVDTPGHADFSSEMERTLPILDGAILVVSCVEGVQAHTRTVWRLLREYHIPTLLFLNKTDRPGADAQHTIAELQQELSPACRLFEDLTGKPGQEKLLLETAAEYDDSLLEQYLEDRLTLSDAVTAIGRLTQECRIFPALSGCALGGVGIAPMLDSLPILFPQEQDPARQEALSSAPLSALCYKIRHDPKGGRVTFLKVLSGTLRPRDTLLCPAPDGTCAEQKVNEVRRYRAAKYTGMPQAEPGDLCGVTGLGGIRPGDRLGEDALAGPPPSAPPLMVKVLLPAGVPPREGLEKLRQLEEEDPRLGVSWDEELQEIHLRILGKVQLEVLGALLQERFSLPVEFGRCEILYRETIAAPVIGYGHFEPLRHYAEVHLGLEPLPRGSGICFESACPTDLLAANWQHLIRTHVLEREHRGVLTGAPLTDVKFTLLAGRAHLKHTEGGDFREAVYRAVRQGLMHAQNVLLEPYYAFSISVESRLLGRVLSDLQRMHASFSSPAGSGDTATILGRGPVSLMMGYPEELVVFSGGQGSISLCFDGYEPCHNTEEIVAAKNYQPTSDMAHTPDSVFCSHGAGFVVKWDEVENYIHIR